MERLSFVAKRGVVVHKTCIISESETGCVFFFLRAIVLFCFRLFLFKVCDGANVVKI